MRRIYDLRHTFATFALRAGISTFDLSRYMGAPVTAVEEATYAEPRPAATEEGDDTLFLGAIWLRPKPFRRLPVRGRQQRRASTGGEAGPSIHGHAGLTVDEGAAALRLRHKERLFMRAQA